MEEKILKIQKIKKGVVIDHIPCGKALKVLRILGIKDDIGSAVSVAMHVPSKRMGLKDIVKVENRFLDEREMDKIALIAPNASVSIIENYQVIEKHTISLPEKFIGVLRCPNPNCITNHEPVKTEFIVIRKDPIILRCMYCERDMYQEEVIEHIV